MAELKYRADIDGLRAIAVLSVLAFHAFPEFIHGGFVGVDIFFVISGYLISSIIYRELENGNFSFIGFYSRRIRRIFPALIIILFTSLLFGWYTLLASEYKQLGEHVACGAAFISNLCLLQDFGYFDAAAESKPLLHLWSLGIEEQFYIFWPILLWIAFKFRRIVFPLLALFTIGSFLLNILVFHRYGMHYAIEVFYLPPTRFWELLAGSVLAYVSMNMKPLFTNQIYRNLQSIIGLALFITAIAIIFKTDPFPGWLALLPVTGAVLLIGAGEKAIVNRLLLSNKLAVWVGLISYPLYLWHWPIFTFTRIIYADTITPLVMGLLIICSVVLASLTYHFVEKPIRSGFSNRTKTKALFMVMLVMGVMGYSVYAHDGISERNDIFKKLDDLSKLNIVKEWRFHTCHMQVDQGDTVFPDRNRCVEVNKRPLVYLWGDSIAASLYPGLKILQNERNFGIAQFTANSCPPLVGYDNPNRKYCKEINDGNIEFIRQVKPETVLLSAAWYDNSNYPLENLTITVRELKKAGVRNIVILGQFPIWKTELPRVLLNSSRSYRLQSNFPLYLNHEFLPNLEEQDKILQITAKNLDINYISPYKLMCNENGCLSQTDSGTPSIMFFDQDHMTPIGAAWLMRKIQNELLN